MTVTYTPDEISIYSDGSKKITLQIFSDGHREYWLSAGGSNLVYDSRHMDWNTCRDLLDIHVLKKTSQIYSWRNDAYIHRRYYRLSEGPQNILWNTAEVSYDDFRLIMQYEGKHFHQAQVEQRNVLDVLFDMSVKAADVSEMPFINNHPQLKEQILNISIALSTLSSIAEEASDEIIQSLVTELEL